MENQVEEIKKKLDIVKVISHFVPLKKRGRHFVTCCPFHQEKTPSFIVSPELQIFKCFGCGKGGDLFTFLQEFEKIDFREALETAAKMAGVTLTSGVGFDKAGRRRQHLLWLNKETAIFFHYILLSHPLGRNCLKYLKDRQIAVKTMKEFVLGFAPADDNLLIHFLRKKGFTDQDLVDGGCFLRGQSNSLYNRFKNRLIFPLFNHRGEICGFSGRILPGAAQDQAKYINSPETEIYHKSELVYGLNLSQNFIRQTRTCLVTEGEFDMISPYQAGIKNGVAVKGTAFTEDQLRLLYRFSDTLILALDTDFAGNTAILRSIELADKMGFDLKVLDLSPRFKDPDEAVRGDLAFFQDRLAHCLSVGDFVINWAVKLYGVDSVRGKKQVLDLSLPVIAKISNTVIRSDYLKKLADVLNSEPEAVFQEFQKRLSLSTLPVTTSAIDVHRPADISQTNLKEKLEERLLALILLTKSPRLVARRVSKQYQFTTRRFRSLLEKLLVVDKYSPATFQSQLSSELTGVFQNVYLESHNFDFDTYRLNLEIKKLINQLTIIEVKEQLRQLAAEITQLEKNDPDNRQKTLEIKYNKLLVKLSQLQCRRP
ncbi:MAG TPA: DNA primase [Candidatus Woesebacteria bacterium]|nr:DNA primase [Candidatus Woesebacteria bacterium]